jgi:hypothetical protein
MHEIASTFAAAGLPSGFHEAAAEVFDRAAREPAGPDSVANPLWKGGN